MPDSKFFLWVVVYDVKSHARQRMIRETLKFKGNRVQDCVYELVCSSANLKRLLDELSFILDETDTVKVYRLCQDCRENTSLFGDTQLPGPPTAIII